MSKIEELIKEKCPDGVEYQKISEVFQRIKGTPITAGKMKEIENPNGEIRIFAGGKTVIDAKEEDIPKANITRVPAVLVQSRGVIDFVYYDKPFTFKNEMWAYTADSSISVKFLYYIFKNNVAYFREAASGMGSLPQISLPVTENYEIPVPPIEVQQEIVRILDKFTELEVELQAELDLRKKQYEHCKDALFAFEKNVVYKNVLDVISMKARVGWQALTKKEYLQEGEYYLITGTDFVEDGSIAFDSCVFVSEERYDMDENIKVHVEDILMTKDGTLGKVAFLEKEPQKPATLNGGVYRLTVITDEVLPRYMYHYFTSHEFKCFVEKVKTGGTIKHLTQKWFETLEVPIPSIEVQKTIIRSLDSFNDLCYKKNIGLVAEIEARHKQYEYYRDKLLTFERKVV